MAGRHIAIVAPPTPGHLNPLQVLGAELLALGHRVTVVHRGDVARLVRGAGIGFAAVPDPAGGTLDDYFATLAAATGPVGLNRMIDAIAVMTDMLLRQAPAVLRAIGADALLADLAEPAGAHLAQRLGLPHATTVTGLPLNEEVGVPPPFLGWRYRADVVGRVRNRGGYGVSGLLMRPVARVLERHRLRHGLTATLPPPVVSVAQCPRGLDYPRAELPAYFRYGAPWRTSAPASPDLPVDLPVDGRPLVFCSLGTLQGSRRRLFATMAQACATIGARAVIGHGGGLSAAEEAALPGDPLVRAFWPQEAVLHRCAAAILHGGFNTVLDALAAGVPMVVLPIAFEQPGTAARVAWIGAGEVRSPRRLTAPALAAALAQVIDRPGYRDNAARLAAEMRATGGAPVAAAAISAALSRRA